LSLVRARVTRELVFNDAIPLILEENHVEPIDIVSVILFEELRVVIVPLNTPRIGPKRAGYMYV